jgi:ABC-2 type transport system ATP-binding protein
LSIQPVLQLDRVTKNYGEFRAVEDLSLSLAPGSICGFLGPNGAGKTTSLRMILDIIKPTRGRIDIFGHASAYAVRRRIGYLPEEKGLYKKMKAVDAIAYFAALKGLGFWQARRIGFELLARYGLGDFANSKIEALSKGMGQKVQVIASIAHDPELVILDEPFSGLDPINQQTLENLIRDFAARGRTVLFSTHVMQHAERLCDRIVLIAKGRKIFDGGLAEARGLLPRRLTVTLTGDVEPLQRINGVVAIAEAGRKETAAGAPDQARTYLIEFDETADPNAVLNYCFEHKLPLLHFDRQEPTLHDVFVELVAKQSGVTAA